MKIEAMLIDFDGTVVNKDLLDVVCGIVGKAERSHEINVEYHQGKWAGISALIERINFLKGVSLSQIDEVLEKESYLMDGAEAFFSFLEKNNIISILTSGSLVPVLQYYQKKLGISYIVGTKPKMTGENNDIIDSISEEDFSDRNFKLTDSKKILDELGISAKEVVAIGDSPADKTIFDFSSASIAINPKGDIAEYADFIIDADLSLAIPVLEKLMKEE